MQKLSVFFIFLFLIFSEKNLFGSGDTLSLTPDWQLTGIADEDFASGMAWADVNGDGFDDLIIGCSEADYDVANQGVVRIYFSTGDTIPTIANQVFSDDPDYEKFGGSVWSAGDVNQDGYDDILVTAYDDTHSRGKVFLYFGSPTGINPTQIWHIDVGSYYNDVNIQVFSNFDSNKDGFDDVIVGDIYTTYDTGDQGSAALYMGTASGLIATPSWKVYGPGYQAFFGGHISVGDLNHDTWLDIATSQDGVNVGVGNAQIYFGSPGGFSSTPSLTKLEAYEDEEFGSDIDISGDLNNDGFADLLISVDNRINGNYTNALEIYYGPITTEIGTPDTTLVYAAFNYGYFASIMWVADFQNDGYDDILLRTRFDNGDNYNLTIIESTADGIATFPQWMNDNSEIEFTGVNIYGDYNGDNLPDIAVWSTSNVAGIYKGSHNFPGVPPLALTFYTGYNMDEEYFGKVISCSGDINNDGINDMISGNPFESDPATDDGRIFFYKGKFPEAEANFSWSYKLFQGGANLGQSVEIVKDFNGDGFDDVIAGAPGYNYAESQNGFVGLFTGKANGITSYPSSVILGGETDASYGYSVTSGDLNGDGNTDFIASAPNISGNSGYITRVYIYFGNGSIPDLTPDIILQHDGKSGFGYKVASGDANGDGFSDVLVTEDYSYLNHPAKVWLYFGGETMDSTADWSYNPIVATQDFGEWISLDADYNNDGQKDITIGNPSYQNGQSLEGCVYIFNGDSIISLTPDKIIESDIVNMKIGSSFTGGDLNGDDFDDLAIGFTEYDLPESNSGVVKIYQGKAAGIDGDIYFEIPGFSGTYSGRTLTYSPDADGDGIGDLFVGHWFTSYTAHGYITMHKGKKSICSLITDTISTSVTDSTISVSWADVSPVIYNIRIRKAGSISWNAISTNLTSVVFEGLDECSAYEIQLNAECDDASGPWKTFFVSTIGCPLPCYLVEIPYADITGITGSTAIITWGEPEEATAYHLRYKLLTSSTWIEFPIPVNMVVLATLTACSNYEVEIKSDCGADTSLWSVPYFFTTTCGGCTTAPAGLYADHISTSAAKLHWIADPGASKYKVYYKATGAASWIIVNAHSNFRTLNGLLPITNYQYKVKTFCSLGIESAFSPVANFTTLPLKTGVVSVAELSIYPSPNNGEFAIQFGGFSSVPLVRIYNSLGQVVSEFTAGSMETLRINMENAEPGIYLIELNDGTQKITQKFIINN